jgi:hypothetical protein
MLPILNKSCFNGKSPLLPTGQEKSDFYREFPLLEEKEKKYVAGIIVGQVRERCDNWMRFYKKDSDPVLQTVVLKKIARFNMKEQFWRDCVVNERFDKAVKKIAFKKINEYSLQKQEVVVDSGEMATKAVVTVPETKSKKDLPKVSIPVEKVAVKKPVVKPAGDNQTATGSPTADLLDKICFWKKT